MIIILSIPLWNYLGCTHKLGSPWDKIHSKNGLNDIIPTEMIQEYYVKLANLSKEKN